MSITTNEKIIDWIVKRAEKEYAEDISMLLAYGSFINGTANAKSDVDCYFIPKTERGYQFAVDFILNGIGYDIFPMNWERVENIANLKEVLLPCVGDVKILFYAEKEDLEKFKRLQNRLRSNLRDVEYTKNIAKERFVFACDLYAKMRICNQLSAVRTYAAYIIMTLADVIALYNQDYFHFGLKKQYEDLAKFNNMPQDFLKYYLDVIQAQDEISAANNCFKILKSVSEHMKWELIIGDIEETKSTEKNNKQPDYSELASLYEEISSTFNKIYICCENGNRVLAFLSAACLQNTLIEASQENNIPYYDIISAYRYDDLTALAISTKKAEDDLVQMIINGGGNIKRFANYEEFTRANL